MPTIGSGLTMPQALPSGQDNNTGLIECNPNCLVPGRITTRIPNRTAPLSTIIYNTFSLLFCLRWLLLPIHVVQQSATKVNGATQSAFFLCLCLTPKKCTFCYALRGDQTAVILAINHFKGPRRCLQITKWLPQATKRPPMG